MAKIYIVPKKNYSVGLNSEVTIEDVAELYSPEMNVAKLNQIVLCGGESKESVIVISPFEIVGKIEQECPNCQVELLSGDDILLVVEDEKKRKSLFRTILNILIYILLFFGSAMTIMYFHLDVGMLDAQKEIIRIFGKDPEEYIHMIGYAYSIGMGIGMLIFFRNRKISDQKVPTPIDLNIIDYENDIVSFLTKKGKKNNG